MSTLSSAAAIAYYLKNISSSTPTPPTPTANKTEPASNVSGIVLQDHPGDKVVAPWSPLPSSAKDYSYTSSGGIAEGHYTEF